MTVAWALFVPALQGPDEASHFTYVQTLAELGELPGDADRPKFSTELGQADNDTNVQPTIFYTIARPEWSASRERAYDRIADTLDREDTGGASPASGYPPLYYGYEAAWYKAASSANFFTRLDVLRLGSVLFALLNTVAAWLLGGAVFRRRTPQLLTAATVGLWPMSTFLSATVTPDALMYPLWTLALWMGVVICRTGLTWRRGLALGVFAGLAMLTKAQSAALLPPLFALVAWAGWRLARRDGAGGEAARAAGAFVLAVAVPVVVWRLISADGSGYSEVTSLGGSANGDGLNVREFVSYLWQFYLPRLGFMTPVEHHVPVIGSLPLFNTWIGTGWGVFGWVNVWFPKWVYIIFAAVTAGMALGGVAVAARWVTHRVPRRRGDLATAVFLGGTALILVAAVHWTDYRYYANHWGLFAQGRYLLPVAAVFACIAAWVLDALPIRVRGAAAGIWLGGLLVLQLASLGLILGRWYA